MKTKNNILICGLGGQGIQILSKLLGEVFLEYDFDIKISNIMGLGQRGGNTECHFRYSNEKLFSPIISVGQADYLISFELNETLRNLHYLKKDGVVISSTFEIATPTVNINLEVDNFKDKKLLLNENVKKIYYIYDESKFINMIFLGFLINLLGFENLNSKISTYIEKNIRNSEENIKAFIYGEKLFNSFKLNKKHPKEFERDLNGN